MDIRSIPIGDLNFAEYNPREITANQFQKLQESIREFGFVEPVVVNVRDGRNVIVSGHMRTRAAKALGYAEVPCYCTELNEGQEMLLNLAMNRISGDWDEQKLAEVMVRLREADATLSLSGFEDDEIVKILDDQQLPSPVPDEGASGEVAGVKVTITFPSPEAYTSVDHLVKQIAEEGKASVKVSWKM